MNHMHPAIRVVLHSNAIICLVLFTGRAALSDETDTFRTDRRVPWTTSNIQGTPDPPDPFRLAVAFPNLKFDNPIDLIPVPGEDLLAVVEQKKGISTFPVNKDVREAVSLLNTAKLGDLRAAAFHPQFAKNGYLYFTYGTEKEMHLARVQCKKQSEGLVADPASRLDIYRWPTGGHTGGCVRFGPDGLLYLATGDGSGHSDTNLYAQDVSDARGCILRFDIDHDSQAGHYRIPPDNPFVGQGNALPEIFAYGLRQPWKMSFDEQGRLWTGDVGQDLWEMVHIIRKGANYGWSITEGSHPFRPERKQGPTPIVPPIVEHHHTEFRSVTGGHVYMSSRLPELQGAYIYGDFDTGRIWMLRYDDDKVGDHKQLIGSQVRIVGFGQDHAGEVYVVGYASGRIYRLETNPAANEERKPFPRKLSETGLFASTAKHSMAPGVVPYSINSPAYADGAIVERFLALPGDSRIEFDGLVYPRGPFAPPGWRFPDGTVLVQTLSVPGADGKPAQRIETRILHHERMPGVDDDYGAQIWRGYTYVWNTKQTDAELAEAAGLDQKIAFPDSTSGKQQLQSWRIPSRTECAVCHNIASKHVVGLNTMQLNRVHSYGGAEENQLAVFARLGLFDRELPAAPGDLPKLTDYRDAKAETPARARAYLHANCSHCHRQWGGGNSSFQLMATMPREEMKIVGSKPAHGEFGINAAQLIAPGEPNRSALLYRVLSIGSAKMPRLGASTVDVEGANLLRRWIAGIPTISNAEAVPAARKLPKELLNSNDSKKLRAVAREWLANTDQSLRLIQAIDSEEVSASVRDLIIEQAADSDDALVRDLFDRYLPEDRRLKRLGDNIDPQTILALTGDPAKGESLFFGSKTLQCRNCHQIKGQGTALGPDLTHVAKMKERAQLLDSIVNPSKEIKPEFQVYLVQTVDGRVLSGLRMPNTGDDVVLKDANNKAIRIKADEVAAMRPQPKSIMPDAQIRSLTAEQLANLLAYLYSLK